LDHDDPASSVERDDVGLASRRQDGLPGDTEEVVPGDLLQVVPKQSLDLGLVDAGIDGLPSERDEIALIKLKDRHLTPLTAAQMSWRRPPVPRLQPRTRQERP